MSNLTHNQVADSLAAHLRGNTDRMVWTDTQLGPAGSPRPDVYTISKSYSRFAADAYEVKVSVSDLRHDLTEGKWQKYRQFAHRVWFAFPRGLAPITEVPRECGVILMGEGGAWRAARKPISQPRDTLPHDAWMKLLIESHPRALEIDTLESMRARQAADWKVQEILRAQLGEEAARLFGDLQAARTRFKYDTDVLREQSKSMHERHEAQRKRLQEEAAAERTWLDDEMRRLAVALGLPAEGSISAHQLVSAMNSMRKRLELADIDRAITQMQAIKTNLAQAIKGDEHARCAAS